MLHPSAQCGRRLFLLMSGRFSSGHVRNLVKLRVGGCVRRSRAARNIVVPAADWGGGKMLELICASSDVSVATSASYPCTQRQTGSAQTARQTANQTAPRESNTRRTGSSCGSVREMTEVFFFYVDFRISQVRKEGGTRICHETLGHTADININNTQLDNCK